MRIIPEDSVPEQNVWEVSLENSRNGKSKKMPNRHHSSLMTVERLVEEGSHAVRGPLLQVMVSLPLCIAILAIFSYGLLLAEGPEYDRQMETRSQASIQIDQILQNTNISAADTQALNDAYQVRERQLWDRSPWDFRGCFYYIGTCVTTIGFGWYYPTTSAGKLLTAFSAFLIPLMATTAFYYASFCAIATDFGLEILSRYFFGRNGHQLCLEVISRVCLGRKGHSYRLYDAILVFNFLSAFFFLSYIMSATEDSWSFIEAMYFMWLSAFTIGITGEQMAQGRCTWLQIVLAVHFFLILFGTTLMILEFVIESFFSGNKNIVEMTAKAIEEHFEEQFDMMRHNMSMSGHDSETSVQIIDEIRNGVLQSIHQVQEKLSEKLSEKGFQDNLLSRLSGSQQRASFWSTSN